MSHVIQNVLEWNQEALRRAKRDVADSDLKVPNHFGHYVFPEGKPRWRKGTQEEFRAYRSRAIVRFTNNIAYLREQLS